MKKKKKIIVIPIKKGEEREQEEARTVIETLRDLGFTGIRRHGDFFVKVRFPEDFRIWRDPNPNSRLFRIIRRIHSDGEKKSRTIAAGILDEISPENSWINFF